MAHDDILVSLSSFVAGVGMLNVDILLTLLKRAGERVSQQILTELQPTL